ncbi:hypothetical protein EON81_14845 [bacterium]|nr:MAG: hypothetical protein EON81_14845 [bacterium]
MNELHKKLVDMYAGRELPSELEDEMEAAAFADTSLSHEMATLRRTVDLLHEAPEPNMTEESYQRVLMRLYGRGIDISPQAKTPVHLQYSLPIQG